MWLVVLMWLMHSPSQRDSFANFNSSARHCGLQARVWLEGLQHDKATWQEAYQRCTCRQEAVPRQILKDRCLQGISAPNLDWLRQLGGLTK